MCVCNQVWGEEYIHVGVYTKFEGEDKELKGAPRIAKASSINTQGLLSLCFPGGEGSLASDKCTLLDMGSGLGGTARVAAKEYGCDVRGRINVSCVVPFVLFAVSPTYAKVGAPLTFRFIHII